MKCGWRKQQQEKLIHQITSYCLLFLFYSLNRYIGPLLLPGWKKRATTIFRRFLSPTRKIVAGRNTAGILYSWLHSAMEEANDSRKG